MVYKVKGSWLVNWFADRLDFKESFKAWGQKKIKLDWIIFWRVKGWRKIVEELNPPRRSGGSREIREGLSHGLRLSQGWCHVRVCSAVLPALFTKGLMDKEATEGKSVSLHCELNKAAANVEWKKGFKTLKPSDKYKMKREGVVAELVIQNLDTADAGNYSCVCGDQQTMAVLTVHGKTNKTGHILKVTTLISLLLWTDPWLQSHLLLQPDLYPQLTNASEMHPLASVQLQFGTQEGYCNQGCCHSFN